MVLHPGVSGQHKLYSVGSRGRREVGKGREVEGGSGSRDGAGGNEYDQIILYTNMKFSMN